MAEIDREKYPSNSYTKKLDKREERKVEKVTKGTVTRKRKTLGKKMSESFFGDDGKGVLHYVIYDVLIPAAKSTISDMVSGGIEVLLFGDTKGRNVKRDKGKSFVSYSSYYNGISDKRDRDRDRSSRARHNFDDIVFETRGEAEEVLSCLVDLIEDYGMASVGDYYDLAGITSNFTDDKYGWDNLSSASVSRDRNGYVINLPKTRMLD